VGVKAGTEPATTQGAHDMTATITTTTTVPATRSARRTLWLSGLASGAAAAVATTAIAGFADAIDHPLTVDGEMIPVLGFAQMTLIGAVLGVVLAKAMRRWASNPPRTFVRATVALTALSCVPDVTMGFDVASALTLIAAHVTAAVIIVPRLADALPE
jgi:hypothetical protein